MKKLISINPANGQKLGEIDTTSVEEIQKKVKKAHQTFLEWKKLGVKKRAQFLKKIIEDFIERKEEIAHLVSEEMGMPIKDSRSDVEDAMQYFEWYLDNAEKYLAPEVTFEDNKTKYVVYHEPVGVVASITPWNYPVSNFVWATGQNLVSGNTVVYKTSEECPLVGKLIEEIVSEHLPLGVFGEVYGDGEVGKALVNSDIDLICFTGSSEVGRYLYKVASEKFIKVVLELGGSAPGIIFADADLEIATENIFYNRFGNCGQTCDGLKRLIVDEKVTEDVIEKLIDRISKSKVGDPSDEDTDIGPLVSEKQLKVLSNQVADARGKEAKVIVGGEKYDRRGNFFQPTIITNVTKDMLVWREEVFGPVLPIVSFRTEEEALTLANDTKYGLGAYVYTADKIRAERVASLIETGMVSINDVSYVKPYNPFGGCKMSGFGREHGKFGFHEISEMKVVSFSK